MPIFSDGFESNNFSAWTGTSASGLGSTTTVTSGAALAGTYGFRAYKPTSSNNGTAQCYKTDLAGFSGKVYIEFLYRIASSTNDGIAGIAYMHNGTGNILEFFNSSDDLIHAVQFRKKDGTMSAELNFGDLQTGVTYKIGLWADYSLATPEFKIFLDGVQQGSTVTDSSSGSVSTVACRLDIGIVEWNWNYLGDIYIDAVVVDNALPSAGGVRLLDRGVGRGIGRGIGVGIA